jgi:hypothetical protein
MNGKKREFWEDAFLLGFCSVIAVAGLAVASWVVAAGRLLSLDGILLTAIALLFVLVFGGVVAWSFHKGEAQNIFKHLVEVRKVDSEKD